MTGQTRPIRSYVLRQGRVSNAQTRAHETLLPRYGIEYSGKPIDLSAVFGRRAKTILEIGCGMGETTAAIAAAHPETDFLGIEVHTPGVGSLLKLIDERYPVYALADLTVQSREVPHDKIVDEIVIALAGHLGCEVPNLVSQGDETP